MFIFDAVARRGQVRLGIDGILYGDLAKENMRSFARVGRRTVRVPFYLRESWLAEHPSLGPQDYLDWLLLLDMLEDQVREEGYEVEEVPFFTAHYSAWLKADGAEDGPEARARYLRGLTTEEVRGFQREGDLRPQAPVAQATMAAVFLLPVAVADAGVVGLMGRLGARLPQQVVGLLTQTLQSTMDLDFGLEVLSPVRSQGVSVDVYPRLIGAADFDGVFGGNYLDWVKIRPKLGVPPRVPRARSVIEAPTDCLGLCIAAFGAATLVERFDAIALDEVDQIGLSRAISQGLGLGDEVLECADTFVEQGRGEEACMEFMGCLLEEAIEDDEGDDGEEDPSEEDDRDDLARHRGDDFRLLSLLQDVAAPPTGRKGVVIPFVARDRR